MLSLDLCQLPSPAVTLSCSFLVWFGVAACSSPEVFRTFLRVLTALAPSDSRVVLTGRDTDKGRECSVTPGGSVAETSALPWSVQPAACRWCLWTTVLRIWGIFSSSTQPAGGPALCSYPKWLLHFGQFCTRNSHRHPGMCVQSWVLPPLAFLAPAPYVKHILQIMESRIQGDGDLLFWSSRW